MNNIIIQKLLRAKSLLVAQKEHESLKLYSVHQYEKIVHFPLIFP